MKEHASMAERQRSFSKRQPIPTSLHFRIEEQTTREAFVTYLEGTLSSPFTLQKWFCGGDGVITAKAQFQSQSKAKQALKVLIKRGKGFEVSHQRFSLPSLTSKIDSFRESVLVKREHLIRGHGQKLDELNGQLASLKAPKRCSPEEFFRLKQKRDIITEKVKECKNQQLEFASFCDRLLPVLEHLKASSPKARKSVEKRLLSMRKQFGRECCRFVKALPIYARRQEIVDTVSHQQVTILIGETGCGKSTQLVQYLYDAHFDNKGIIACTQPRKVAAVTLATHVSVEMGAKLGVEIGYKTGMQGGRFSENTRVVFLTDHALLNECVEDRNFAKYSCIIVDEAHERSLQTDILLALIKRCLSERPDLRVIITSATIDPQQFTEYFGPHCPILRVSGRMFPVSVVWNPLEIQASPIDTDYWANAVTMADSIHREGSEGDILVFLTSALEIDRACAALTRTVGDTAVVLPLHGRLQPDDQQKVFQHYGLRKIVFATNVAETSVTIPGVKYIVDTGLVKELIFDPKKNMNSLEVRPISKSSAEQRKGRAGRTSEGKCYRLYSPEVYDTLSERTAPEILRVHLTHAALKLFQLGVGNILQFDFVEAPDQDALSKAMETLHFLEAVKGNELTDLGKRMAILPIDPQLAKILFLGVDAGIGQEAAISVAMSSCGGAVFFRSDEVKEESDRKKIQFCHPAGDQMTNLNVYWRWAQQKKEDRNKWCVANYINAKTMRLVEDVVKELRFICDQQFNIMLHAKIPNLQLAEERLPKLYFEVFMRNISVFLGHERVGYMTQDLIGEAVVIFPGSALPTLNEVPEFLVFEKTLKTSQHFLLQVTPVKEEWVEEAVATKRMSIDPNAAFNQYFVSPVRVSHIGQEVFKIAFFGKGKLQKVKQDLSHTCNGTPHFFLMQQDKAAVSVYSQAQYHQVAKTLISDVVKGVRTEMKGKVFEWGVTCKEDDVRVILGAGGSIQHILMPYDYQTLIVKGHRSEAWMEEYVGLFSNYGEIASINSRADLSSTFVTFCSPDDAAEAFASIQPYLEDGVTVRPKMKKPSGEPGSQFKVKVEWCRRKRQNFAFIHFHSIEDCMIAQHNLRSLFVDGSFLNFRPSKDGQPQLFVTKVGQQVSEESLKRAVESHLEIYGVSVKGAKIGLEKSSPTTPEQLQALHSQLDQVVAIYATKGQYTIDLKSPQPYHKSFMAFLQFCNPEEGHRALNGLCHEQIGDNVLMAKACLSSSITFPKNVFAALKDTVAEAMEEARLIGNGLVSVKLHEPPSRPTTLVNLVSDDVQAFIQAKNLLNCVLQPDTIQCLTPELRQYILRKSTREELETIASATGTFITSDLRVMTVNIYGSEGNCTRAKMELNRKIDETIHHGVECSAFNLKAPGRPPGLMKFVVSQFGTDLSTLLEREGVSGATLDARRHILTLYSTPEALEAVQELIESFCARRCASDPATLLAEEDNTCCACYCPIEEVAEQYRLEYCGHLYCMDCVKLQLSPAAVTFPITCAAEDCEQPFVWHDFESLFKRSNYRLEDLLKSSLQSYVQTNQKKVRPCPTPNCDMVYRVSTTDNGRPFLCSHCGVQTCTRCHVQYHDGLTCAMYESGKKTNKEFEAWLKKDPSNRKKCPSCSTPIEKIEGCQHMTCRCGAHICWFCLQYFKEAQQCYAHLQRAHGRLV